MTGTGPGTDDATGFPWLPMGTALPGGATLSRLVAGAVPWQLCGTRAGGHLALLLRPSCGPGPDGAWWEGELEALREAVPGAAQGAARGAVPGAMAGGVPGPPATLDGGLLCLMLPAASRAATVRGMGLRNPLPGRAEAEALGGALAALHRRLPGAPWSTALFLPDRHLVLAAAPDGAEDRRAVLVAALAGGVRDPALPPERIAALNGRLDRATVAAVLEAAGNPVPGFRPGPAPDGFVLPGQPALEAALRERVLDVLHRPAEYARLGVPRPGGVLLAGPPGCGKSFAVGRLAAFLGWPLHEISVGTVGSMWLHETSRRLAEAFDAAAAEAPAVVLLEELDALGKQRAGGHGATVDEVNTLLRLVENAPARGLLVLGTTNRLDAIDPALRRHGRFDHVVTMDHADERGTEAVLEGLLRARPHAPGLDLRAAARRLARRPAADAVWVVNEAARLAVRGGHEAIDDLVLARALHGLGA